jgi:hypothetical protein
MFANIIKKIKQIVIKRIKNKFKEKTNLMIVLKNLRVMR